MIELEKELSQKLNYQENKTEENNDSSTFKKSTNTVSSQKASSEIAEKQKPEENKIKYKKNREIEKIQIINKNFNKNLGGEGSNQYIIGYKKKAIICKNILLSSIPTNKSYLLNGPENGQFTTSQSVEVGNDMIKPYKAYDIDINSKICYLKKVNIFYEPKIEKNEANLKFKYSSVFYLYIKNINYSVNFKAIIVNNKFDLSINIIKYKNNFSSYFLENLQIFKDFNINPLELLSSGNIYNNNNNQADLECTFNFDFPKNNKYFNSLKYELNKSFYKVYKQGYNACKLLNKIYNKIKQIIFKIENDKIYKYPTLRNREYPMLIEEQNKNNEIKNEDYSILIIEYEYKVEIEHVKEIDFYDSFIEFCSQ
jgi:hypothetical protein